MSQKLWDTLTCLGKIAQTLSVLADSGKKVISLWEK